MFFYLKMNKSVLIINVEPNYIKKKNLNFCVVNQNIKNRIKK